MERPIIFVVHSLGGIVVKSVGLCIPSTAYLAAMVSL